MAAPDLTPFGFTPTESLVYAVLLRAGRGTGYAVARQAGLARANAYSALEGLVMKGAARLDPGQPKQYRAESPEALLVRLANHQGSALDRLELALAEVSQPESPTFVELSSPRGVLQTLAHDIGRASQSVALLAPADAYPLLGPPLRRAAAAGLDLDCRSTEPVTADFTVIRQVSSSGLWAGEPVVAVVDGIRAVVATRSGGSITGLWSSLPVFVSTARIVFSSFGTAG